MATATDVRTSDFCGFEGVHVGYRDELRRPADPARARTRSGSGSKAAVLEQVRSRN